MPRQARPPRLWPRPERRDKNGTVTHAATWVILDRGKQISTGVHLDDREGANKALADHINRQYAVAARSGPRDASQIPVTDVLNLYATDIAPKHANPAAAYKRIARLAAFFGDHFLADINGKLCRDYIKASTTDVMARSDLVLLRAAINHHLEEGLHNSIIKVVMPDRRPARERWLTRSEAARIQFGLVAG
jgi:hypothetical protein